MDHTEAVRLQAAEKYVLKELSPTLMEEYEEHFFDCAECGLDIKAATAFVDASREVFREQPERELVAQDSPSTTGWFAWLKPAFAVPVFAALLIFIGYQNIVTIPEARHGVSIVATERFRATFLSRGAMPSDGSGDSVRIHAGQPFSLAFDFTPRTDKAFPRYIAQLKDALGHKIYQAMIPAELALRGINLSIPGGLVQQGKYNLVMYGDSGSGSPVDEANIVGNVTFSVEFLR
jgi:hypothetical protein